MEALVVAHRLDKLRDLRSALVGDVIALTMSASGTVAFVALMVDALLEPVMYSLWLVFLIMAVQCLVWLTVSGNGFRSHLNQLFHEMARCLADQLQGVSTQKDDPVAG